MFQILLAAPWNDDLIEEYVQFPHGAHDDQVDAGSLGWDAVQKRSGMTVA